MQPEEPGVEEELGEAAAEERDQKPARDEEVTLSVGD